jgi:hypothetical protein
MFMCLAHTVYSISDYQIVDNRSYSTSYYCRSLDHRVLQRTSLFFFIASAILWTFFIYSGTVVLYSVLADDSLYFIT